MFDHDDHFFEHPRPKARGVSWCSTRATSFAPEEKFVVAKWYIWQKCNYDSIHRHLKYFNQCIFYCYKLSNWTFWAEEFIFFYQKLPSVESERLKGIRPSTYLCDHRSTWNNPMFQNYYNFPLFTETLMLVSSSNR